MVQIWRVVAGWATNGPILKSVGKFRLRMRKYRICKTRITSAKMIIMFPNFHERFKSIIEEDLGRIRKNGCQHSYVSEVSLEVHNWNGLLDRFPWFFVSNCYKHDPHSENRSPARHKEITHSYEKANFGCIIHSRTSRKRPAPSVVQVTALFPYQLFTLSPS